jgi:FtsZ-interacting cell division protein ZipA
MDPFTLAGALKLLLSQGVLGIVCVIFVTLWLRERKGKDDLAKSFNRQISKLNKEFDTQIAIVNEKRTEEVRLVAEALQSTSDNSLRLSQVIDKLRDFIIERGVTTCHYLNQLKKRDKNNEENS